MKSIINKLLSATGYIIVNKSKYEDLKDIGLKQNIFVNHLFDHDILIRTDTGEKLSKLKLAIKNSKSQIRQDVFTLSQLEFKENGFFVEFGATDGIGLSNTYMLESFFNWDGILAEPCKHWHHKIKSNRNVSIDQRCVWKYSNEILLFDEVVDPELSGISHMQGNDVHSKIRRQKKTYKVKTVSLMDLLKDNNAPSIIDYLSIDTEGSEYEILSNFNFNQYDFKIITCEHGYTGNREKIFELLTKNGYRRIFSEYSRFDDWYINKKFFDEYKK